MMNQRTDRTLIVILLSAMLLAAYGCGEEDNSSTADMSGEEPSTALTAGIRGLLVDDATKRDLGQYTCPACRQSRKNSDNPNDSGGSF